MRYWVYGVDGISREPRDPLFIEAATEEDARAQAKEMGMAAEEVEAVQPKAIQPPASVGAAPAPASAESERSDSGNSVARILVRVFRVLAGIVGLLYLVLFFITVDAASKAEEIARKAGSPIGVPLGATLLRVILEAVLVVSLLLAAAELLRLGIALERNTRGRTGPEEKRRRNWW
jgi:hypothetical protein